MKLFKRKEKEKIGLFIIHGYLSNPEVSFMGLKEILIKNKIDGYYFATVQGHGVGVDPNTFNYQKAIDLIEAEYKLFSVDYDVIYIMGFSMGGALATYLAAIYGADKLVLLAPALKYGGDNRLLDKIGSFMKSSKEEEESASDLMTKTLGDAEAKNLIMDFVNSSDGDGGTDYKKEFNERLGKLKISVFVNFVKLISRIGKDIKNSKIYCPARIYISENDDLVPLEGALYAFNRVTSTDKQLKVYSGVKHRLLASSLRKEIIEDFIKFLYGKKKIKWPKEKK